MIISVVGSPDSGKTTVIEKIVPVLIEKGLKIAVVKHHAHGDFDFDKEGKDSWKFYQSGADVAISSPTRFALIKRVDELQYDLEYVYDRYLSRYDLVLTEGFSRAGKDRIVVVNSPEEISRFENGRIIAVVCKRSVPGYTTFRLQEEDLKRLANLVYDHYQTINR
jgi:molybdopterin-guanine dinucleotide biosynthesis protein B